MKGRWFSIPIIANYYLAWGQQWPAQFIRQAEAAGATPYDPADRRELGGGVVAVPGGRIDLRRPEQAEAVVVPEHLHADLAQAGEFTDQEHAER